VGGEEVPAKGFEVCEDCNRVGSFGAGEDQRSHAPYCEYYGKAHVEPETREVYLHRSFRTEALRLLVSVFTYRCEEAVTSLKAAVELGFRQAFQGVPEHLQVIRASEPVSEDARHRRHFLYVYDKVPGGTGYLEKLAGSEQFRDLLAAARESMDDCDCADGCYRCVYAYQNQWELDRISKSRGVALLDDILDGWDQLEAAGSLSEVSLEMREESELELRFRDALRRLVEGDAQVAGDGGSFEKVAVDGGRAYRLEVAGRSWEVLPQYEVGGDEGVEIPSRPDFVLRPTDESSGQVRLVAVFCDGFRYHVQPGHDEDRLVDDIRKREALRDSGRFVVWSLTWRDVDAVLEDEAASHRGLPFIREPERRTWEKVWPNGGFGPGALPKYFSKHGAVELLVDYLAAPEVPAWRRAAQLRLLAEAPTGPRLVDDEAGDVEEEFIEGEYVPTPEVSDGDGVEPPEGPVGYYWRGSHHAILARYDELPTPNAAPEVTVRWQRPAAEEGEAFRGSWYAVLGSWNLLQFLKAFGVEVGSDTG
jgi:DEAD/DEAH box helicase domain-containing protein